MESKGSSVMPLYMPKNFSRGKSLLKDSVLTTRGASLLRFRFPHSAAFLLVVTCILSFFVCPFRAWYRSNVMYGTSQDVVCINILKCGILFPTSPLFHNFDILHSDLPPISQRSIQR